MNPFQLKQFSVYQDQSAMKIGTDAILLGAWTCLEHNPNTILDIGAGTGILALMMAQRSQSQLIDAIEIEPKSYEQCVTNFEESPWCDRLFCYHASLEEFTNDVVDSYDLIICNPPFYSEDFKTANSQRDLARFQDAMPFAYLLDCVSKLLSKNGAFSVIIPFKEEALFITIASKCNLFPNKILHVKGNPTSQIKRSLIHFSFQVRQVEETTLIIETSRHQYTPDYIELTKDFYLKM